MSKIKYKIGTDCCKYLCRGIYDSDGIPNVCEEYSKRTFAWERSDDAWDVMCGWAPGYAVSAAEAKKFIADAKANA